jgi:hypothetical protein
VLLLQGGQGAAWSWTLSPTCGCERLAQFGTPGLVGWDGGGTGRERCAADDEVKVRRELEELLKVRGCVAKVTQHCGLLAELC